MSRARPSGLPIPAPSEIEPAGEVGDGHLREQTLETTQVYRGHFLDVRSDRVQLPDGGTAGREYIVHPGAVMVVPLLDDGRVVIERQWRYPLARVCLLYTSPSPRDRTRSRMPSSA